MNIRTRIVFTTIFLALSVIAVTDIARADPTVESATPNFADQGTLGLEVEIGGSGFSNDTGIAFYVTGTDDPGGVTVIKTKARGKNKVVATIDVDLGATISEFDIEAFSRSGNGRGRGTSLFHVHEFNSGKTCAPWPQCKGNAGIESPDTCNAIYYGYPAPDDPAYDPTNLGPCVSELGGECEVIAIDNDNTPGMALNENCVTTQTLVVPASLPFFNGQGIYSLRLAAGTSGVWEGGRAGIMNESRGVRFGGLTLIADGAGAANGSCPGDQDDPPSVQHGTLAAAASINQYRDTGTHIGPRPVIYDITVRTINGAKFCNGIEFGGATVDSLMADDTGFRGGAGLSLNIVEAGTYARHGLLMQHVDLRSDPDLGVMMDNQVYSSPGACAGIKVTLVERLEFSGNTVFAPDGCDGNPGVGIVIEQSGVDFVDPSDSDNVLEDAEPVEFVNNIVDTTGGASDAVLIVESALDKNEKNDITCDTGDVSYSVSAGSTVPFSTHRRRVNVANGDQITAAGQVCN
jgi:hypothetical protein